MPGHVAKSSGPDPDPDPWLKVSDELFVKLKAKPYDAKKSCWVPDKATGGYDEGLIESADGEKITVKILGKNEVSFKYDVTDFTHNSLYLASHFIFSILFKIKLQTFILVAHFCIYYYI